MIVQSTAVTRVGHVKSNVTDKLHVPHATNPKTVSTPSPDNDAQITNRKLDKRPTTRYQQSRKDLGSRGKKGLLQVETINFNKSFTDQTPLVELQSLFPYLLLSKQDPGCVLVRHHCHHLLEKDPRYFEYSQLLADLLLTKRHHLTARAKALLGEAYIPSPQEGHTIDQLKHVLSLNPNFRFAGNFADPLTSFFSLIPSMGQQTVGGHLLPHLPRDPHHRRN